MYSFKKAVVFTYLWLNYCDENTHHIEKIPVAVKNIDHLFRMASEMIGGDNLHLFLLSDGTRIPRKPRKRYRINCLYGGTNGEIVGLF